jgi:hypothetical protein
VVCYDPISLKLFLYIFLIVGFYNLFQLSQGDSVDLFGLFLFFTIPITLLNYLIPKFIISINADHLSLNKKYLFRRTIKKIPTTQINTIEIKSNRGTYTGGTYSLILKTEKQRIALISGFASLNSSNAHETLERMIRLIEKLKK